MLGGVVVIAIYTRCCNPHTVALDPLHYLAASGRKPGPLTMPRCTGIEAPRMLRCVPRAGLNIIA